MTSPVSDPTGKRAQLSGLRAAFAASVLAAVAAGVLLSSNPTAPPPVVTPPAATATGCLGSTPGAVVIRFADATTSGVIPRADITPLVICGARPIAYAMQTYVQWVAAGPCPCKNGPATDTTSNPYDRVILSPADTSALWTPLDSVLTRSDSVHWVLPDSARIRWKLLGGMLYTMMGQAQVPGVKDQTPVPVIGWWSYVPVRGALSRTQLSVNPVIANTDSTLSLTLTRSAPDSS